MSFVLLEHKARKIAEKAHARQTDKAGAPYIGHLKRVHGFLYDNNAKLSILTLAWLHDLLEDTEWTEQDLKNEGFPEKLIVAVLALTKVKGEAYEDYLERVAQNPDATLVKLADLEDNMDVTRLPNELTDKDLARIRKYHKAYNFLKLIK